MLYIPKISEKGIDYDFPAEITTSSRKEIRPQINHTKTSNIPTALVEFDTVSSWSIFTTSQLKGISKSNLIQNLYIDDFQLRRHQLNAIFKEVHQILDNEKLFAFKFVTSENSKQALQRLLPRPLFFIYYPWFFFFKRVLPKLNGFRKLSRILDVSVEISKAEIIGRLIYSGFEIVSISQTDNDILIVTKINPIQNPSLAKPEPSEGIIFKTHRIGIDGIPLTIYKFRSMHPYAEYVQEFIHDHNGLEAGGKFKNDFRVSTGGRIIRKYWIDELPMLFNLLKGDMKIVGVRPISEHYFGLYPTSLQNLRLKHKPGLLPPFYADMPESFDEIVQSEIRYLKSYEAAPLQTDWYYFTRIVKNIFINKARSQ